LLQSGAEVNGTDRRGFTVLRRAVQTNHVEVVRVLLEAGADVEKPDDEDGLTPLMEAANFNHPDVARVLLEHGADVNARSGNGATALMYGVSGLCGDFETPSPEDVVAVLLEKGADVNVKDQAGKSALRIAMEMDGEEYAQVLRGAGAR
jgi:uncharacterized protein